MSKKFKKAVKIILELEGGYIDDPQDRGGRTKYGISQRAYPQLDIANLTQDKAIQLYYQNYWLTCRCDELPHPLSLLVFDMAVNSGVNKAISLLQYTINYHFNKTLSIDGIIGTNTLLAIQEQKNDTDIAMRYLAQRAVYYVSLSGTAMGRYLAGWINRLSLLLKKELENDN